MEDLPKPVDIDRRMSQLDEVVRLVDEIGERVRGGGRRHRVDRGETLGQVDRRDRKAIERPGRPLATGPEATAERARNVGHGSGDTGEVCSEAVRVAPLDVHLPAPEVVDLAVPADHRGGEVGWIRPHAITPGRQVAAHEPTGRVRRGDREQVDVRFRVDEQAV